MLIVVAFILFLSCGFLFTFVQKFRRDAGLAGCMDNLRSIALFAAHNSQPEMKAGKVEFPKEIPAGTIVLDRIPPEDRLSWVVAVLPGLDQKRQNVGEILHQLDHLRPWKAERNQIAGRFKLASFLCPGNPAEIKPEAFMPTMYLGIAGLGVDSATLELPPFPLAAPPRAGCFRYDSRTPFASITDGLSQTILIGERATDLGPWLRGGPGTIRGLDDSENARIVLGDDGQFGGNHATVANFAFADGSVRTMSYRTDPKVLFGLATIAGGENDPMPGE